MEHRPAKEPNPQIQELRDKLVAYYESIGNDELAEKIKTLKAGEIYDLGKMVACLNKEVAFAHAAIIHGGFERSEKAPERPVEASYSPGSYVAALESQDELEELPEDED